MTTEHPIRLSAVAIEADACLCPVAIGWMSGSGAFMAGWSTWFPALSRTKAGRAYCLDFICLGMSRGSAWSSRSEYLMGKYILILNCYALGLFDTLLYLLGQSGIRTYLRECATIRMPSEEIEFDWPWPAIL
ncbi:hypothetical protein J3E68DRAFT_389555 [Trichoderma sp. SZMC 28012]